MQQSEKSVQLWFFFVCILVGTVIYSNTLHVPFYLDDNRNIRNPALELTELSVGSVMQAGFEGTLKKRPVSNITFAVNRFLDGYNVTGYHLVNIAVHISAAIFLFLLFHATLSLPVNQEKTLKFPALAFIAALIWLVHPLATQSVTYIVQRMNSMASMFYVLSLLFYVWGRVKQEEKGKKSGIFFFVGSFVSGLLALGSKEIAVTLPFFIALYEWYFFQDLDLQWLRRKVPWIIGLFLLLLACVFFYTNGHPLQYLSADCAGRDFTMQERLLTQPRVVVHYMSLLLFPHPSRLLLDYNFPLSHSLLQPVSTIISLGALGGMLLASFFLARRERLLSFCLLWFLGNLVIESSVICLEMIFEHRTYLPSMFFFLLMTVLLYRLLRRAPVIVAVSLLLVAVLGVWTVQRNMVWADPVAFWTDCLQNDPDNPRAHSNLGNAYFYAGDPEKAKQHYRRALDLEPEFRWAQDNIGVACEQLGDLACAEAAYREMIRLEPRYGEAYNRLARLLEKQGKLAEALQEYEQALEYAPEIRRIHRNAGRVLLDLGRAEEAVGHLNAALHKQADDGETLVYLGEALARLGQEKDAMEKFRRAIASDPELVSAHFNLAQLLLKHNDPEQALVHFQEVEKRSPEMVPALFNIALLLSGQGRYGESALYFEKLITLVPPNADLYNTLGVQLLMLGRLNKAEEAFLQALEVDAGHAYARRNLQIAVKRQEKVKIE